MERIYTESYISKSLNLDKWETDQNGNPVVIIEASNENLDYDGEKVMRDALINSKDYFLQNGVISYDHKHLPTPENQKSDINWTAEKYIIGKPLDVFVDTGKDGKQAVKVKAVLSKSNCIAKEIIKKLQDGLETVKASVGGRRARKDNNAVTGVDWDEVALTYKPVNQTLGATVLSPKNFVKSLTAGSSVDPGNMGNSGNTLQSQSLEKEAVSGLLYDLKKKKIKKKKDAIDLLEESGMTKSKAEKVLKEIIDKNYLGEVIMAKENVNYVVDNATDELLKAINELEGTELSKAGKMSDGEYVVRKGCMYLKKSDGSYEKMNEEDPDYEEDEEDMEKSLDEIDVDTYVDAEDVIAMRKSINAQNQKIESLESLVKSLVEVSEKQTTLLKSIGSVTAEDSKLLKSISDAPAGRRTGNVQVNDRFQKSQVDKLNGMDAMSLQKSMKDNGVDTATRNNVLYTFRKQGMPGVIAAHPSVAEKIVKE